MNPLPKCFLLPIDDSPESLDTVPFLTRLYPDKQHISIILAYFVPPLPQVYKEKPVSKAMAEKRKEVHRDREEATRAVFDRARAVLVKAGFADDLIQESTEERQLSHAHHACRLADIKKVDAVVVNRYVGGRLEGFLQGDHTGALLNHCLVSPVWFIGGEIDPSRAAVCIQEGNESLRAADHATFMLAETGAEIDLVCPSRKASHKIVSAAHEHTPDLERWLKGADGKAIRENLRGAMGIVQEAGIPNDLVNVIILPSKGKVATELIHYCRSHSIGIVVLGHSEPEGMLGFMKGSITKKILPEIEDVAVWVQQ